jgi:hypothetical protein
MIETQTEQTVFEDAAYRAWMTEVDRALERMCGLASDELPDYGYRDAFDAGEPPGEVATEVLEGIDFDGGGE